MESSEDIIELNHKIAQYKADIAELKEAYEYIACRRIKINDEVLDSERCFDMMAGDKFRGNLELEAEEYRDELIFLVDKAQKDVYIFLENIQKAIVRLDVLIEECEQKKRYIELKLHSYNMGE